MKIDNFWLELVDTVSPFFFGQLFDQPMSLFVSMFIASRTGSHKPMCQRQLNKRNRSCNSPRNSMKLRQRMGFASFYCHICHIWDWIFPNDRHVFSSFGWVRIKLVGRHCPVCEWTFPTCWVHHWGMDRLTIKKCRFFVVLDEELHKFCRYGLVWSIQWTYCGFCWPQKTPTAPGEVEDGPRSRRNWCGSATRAVIGACNVLANYRW